MLTAEQMKSLKQVNVSKDAEKTKLRIKGDFNSVSKEQRRAIVELSGQKRNSFYRVFDTGSANARIVLAMAQTLELTPFYYTGEEDNKQPLQDASIRQFLESHGYIDLLQELNDSVKSKPKRKYNRKPKNESAPVSDVDNNTTDETEASAPIAENVIASEQDAAIPQLKEAPGTEPKSENAATQPDEALTINIGLTFPDSPQMRNAVAKLSDDDATQLLRALFMRAKAGGDAARIVEIVKRCLLV